MMKSVKSGFPTPVSLGMVPSITIISEEEAEAFGFVAARDWIDEHKSD